MKLIFFFAIFYLVFGEQIQDENSFMVCVPMNSLNILINGTGYNSQKTRSPTSLAVNKLLTESADKIKEILVNSNSSSLNEINTESSTSLDSNISVNSSQKIAANELINTKRNNIQAQSNEQLSQTENYLPDQYTTVVNQLRDERLDDNENSVKEYTTISNILLKDEESTTVLNNFYKRLDFSENKDEESVTLVNQLVSESEKNNEVTTPDPSLNKGRSILPEEEMNARQNGLISSLLSSINPSNIMNGQNRLPSFSSDSKIDTKNETKNDTGNKNSVEQSESSLRVSDDNSKAENYKNSSVSTTTQSTISTSTNTSSTNTTLSENQIEQQKIFEEFFGSRQSVNSNLLVLLDSIKAKLGIGNPHLRPIEVKKKLEQELQFIKSGTYPPTTEAYSVSTASYINPSSNYKPSNQNSDNPKYISYDEAKKQLELMNNHKDSYENDYKNDLYKNGDNKNNLDIPIVVALKPDKKLNKPVADYTEHEKNYALPKYPIGYRAGLPSYDLKKPILSRYNKLVSGVSKGYSKFRPPYQNEKKGYIVPNAG